jgi:hypothetical protein
MLPRSKPLSWAAVKWDDPFIIPGFTQERKTVMKWKDMPLAHKIATVISGLALLVWLIPRVRPNLLPFDPTYPAIAVFTVCEAVTYWKTKRVLAWIMIGAAAISITCCILELML